MRYIDLILCIFFVALPLTVLGDALASFEEETVSSENSVEPESSGADEELYTDEDVSANIAALEDEMPTDRPNPIGISEGFANVETDVGSDGAYTYSIPIKLPEFRGLEPKLALNYNSQNLKQGSVDHIMGVGWRLGGYSVIERRSAEEGLVNRRGVKHHIIGDIFKYTYALDGEALYRCSAEAEFVERSSFPLNSFGFSVTRAAYSPSHVANTSSASCAWGGSHVTLRERYQKILEQRVSRTINSSAVIRIEGNEDFEIFSRSNIEDSYFYVTDRDGRRRKYESLLPILMRERGIDHFDFEDGMTILDHLSDRFLLTEVSDTQLNPNIVSYEYAFGKWSDGYAYRPSKITYGKYVVRFLYGDEKANTAPAVLSPNGWTIGFRQRQRLEAIEVLAQQGGSEQKIRAYSLEYKNSDLTRANLLTSVREYANNYQVVKDPTSGRYVFQSGDHLPPWEFTYNSDVPKIGNSETITLANAPSEKEVFNGRFRIIADANLDKRDEIYRTMNASGGSKISYENGVWTSSKNPSIPTVFFSGKQSWRESDNHTSYEVSRNDTIAFLTDRRPFGSKIPRHVYSFEVLTEAYISNLYPSRIDKNLKIRSHEHSNWTQDGRVVAETRIGSSDDEDMNIFFGQFDRDEELEVLFNRTFYDIGPMGELQPKTELSRSLQTILSQNNDLGRMTMSDIDGDGIDEVIDFPNYFHDISDGGLRSKRYYMRPPSAFGNANVPRSGETPSDLVVHGDVNGDGLPDILVQQRWHGGKIIVGLSEGTRHGVPDTAAYNSAGRWAAPVNELSETVDTKQHFSATALRDINGDGFADLIFHLGFDYRNPEDDFHEWPLQPYLDRPGKEAYIFYSDGTKFLPEPRVVPEFIGSGDFNGDGLPDFIAGYPQVYFNQSEPAHLMRTVKEPLGATIAIDYMPSSEVEDNQIPGIQQLVAKISKNDGTIGSAPAVTEFSYNLGRYKYDTRKSLGYGQVIAKLPPSIGEENGPILTTRYYQYHYGTYGMVKTQDLEFEGKKLWGKENWITNSYWSQRPLSALVTYKAYYDYASPELPQSLEEKSDLSRRHLTKYTYNDFGLPTKISEYVKYAQDPQIDVTVDKNIFYFPVSNAATYIPSLKRREQVVTNMGDEVPRTEVVLSDIEYHYDNLNTGNLSQVSKFDRTIWKGSYDNAGNLVQEEDAKGNKSSYKYDLDRNLFRVSETNALGHMAATTWDARCQVPSKQVAANGLKTLTETDGFCREVKVNIGDDMVVTTVYQKTGDPNKQYIQIREYSNKLKQQLSRIRHYFNGFGLDTRLLEFHGEFHYALTGFVYDARQNVIRKSIPLDPSLIDTFATAPADRFTHYKYDGADRLYETIAPDGSKTTQHVYFEKRTRPDEIAVLDRVVEYRDEDCYAADGKASDCNPTHVATDRWGQVVSEKRGDGTITRFEYDGLGRLEKITAPGGMRWHYTYDNWGNRTRSNDPALGVWTMAYDLNGNLIRSRDAKKQTISFKYDALNRVTNKTTGKGKDRFSIIYSYDQGARSNVGQLTKAAIKVADPKSDLAKRYPGGHYIKYTYDLYGNPTTSETLYDGRKIKQTQVWIGNGLPLNLGFELDKKKVATLGSYSYDKMGRTTAVSGPINLPLIKTFDYNRRRQPVQYTYGSNVTDIRSYSATRGWIDSFQINGSGGKVLQSYEYSRGPTSRVERLKAHGANRFQLRYSYDRAGRLKSVKGDKFDQSFAYNKSGSMTSNSRIGVYKYHRGKAAPYQIVLNNERGVQNLEYDRNGNMITGLDGKTMTYDSENRPLGVKFGRSKTQYVYAADGTRLVQIENAGKANARRRVTFGFIEISDFGDPKKELVKLQLHPNVSLSFRNKTGKNAKMPKPSDWDVNYLHRDQLESIVAITDKKGTLVKTSSYRPFGTELETIKKPSSPEEARGFIGQYFDDTAGLQYLIARYYDPKLGVFVKPDMVEVSEPRSYLEQSD